MSTRNVTKAYRLATDLDLSEGWEWYASAKAYAATLDDNVSRAAGIIAALSPCSSWTINKSMAAQWYEGRRNVHTAPNVAKAQRIWDGEDPMTVLGGPKVRAFYLNIMGIDDKESVTIDRHAMMVCEGRVISDKELATFFNVRNNRRYAEEYRRAASILSKECGMPLSPAQVQAVTWVWWRRNHSAFSKRNAA